MLHDTPSNVLQEQLRLNICKLCSESCVTHSRRLCSLLSKISPSSSRNDARIKPKVIIAGATLLGTAFRQSFALNINKMWLKLSHLLSWLPHSTKATRAVKCRGTQLSLLTGRAVQSDSRMFWYMQSGTAWRSLYALPNQCHSNLLVTSHRVRINGTGNRGTRQGTQRD